LQAEIQTETKIMEYQAHLELQKQKETAEREEQRKVAEAKRISAERETERLQKEEEAILRKAPEIAEKKSEAPVVVDVVEGPTPPPKVSSLLFSLNYG